MYLDLRDVRYHVEIVGQGEPLLMLHGFTGCGANWREVAEFLGDRFKVVMPDLLGHGNTDAPSDVIRYAIEAQAADLIALMDALDIERTVLWGYSMGGRLALYSALHYPSRFKGLVLESASPGLESEAERAVRRESDGALAARILREGVPPFVEYWESLALWESQKRLPAEKLEALRAQRLTNRGEGLARSLWGMGTGAQPSLWENLAALTLPTLAMAGARDVKFVDIAQRMAARLPNVHIVFAEDAGHAVHFENPSWVTETFMGWLSKIE